MSNDSEQKQFARPTPIDSVMYLTKRELIAAMAMQGMLANPEIIKIMTEAKVNPDDQADFLSVAAVEQGDSLLNQLSKS